MRIVAIEVPVRSLRRKSTLRKWFLRPVLRCRCFVALLDANLGDLARCDREPSNSEAGFDFHIHFATGIVFEPCQNRQRLFEPGTREELDFLLQKSEWLVANSAASGCVDNPRELDPMEIGWRVRRHVCARVWRQTQVSIYMDPMLLVESSKGISIPP